MKFYATVLIVVLAIVAFVQAQDDDMRVEFCKKDAPKLDSCLEVKCNKANTRMSATACALLNCPNGVLRVEEDKSKPYPDCCPRPICEP